MKRREIRSRFIPFDTRADKNKTYRASFTFFLLQFWSAYVPCSSQHHDSVQLALEQIDLIRRLVNKHPESMVLVTTAEGELFRWRFVSLCGRHPPAKRKARPSVYAATLVSTREGKKTGKTRQRDSGDGAIKGSAAENSRERSS